MQQSFQINRKENKRKSLVLSILFHILLLILLLWPCFRYFDSPAESATITIMPEPRQFEASNTPNHPQKSPKAIPVVKNENSASKNQGRNTASKSAKSSVTEAKKIYNKEIAAEKAEIANKSVGRDASPVKSEVIDTGPTAEELAEKARAEESARKDRAKSRFGSLFGRKTEDGQASSESPDSGLPDAAALKGLTEALSSKGEGLDDRGILFQPHISDHTQKTGKVVIRICVNSDGQVVSSRFTQKGSTTTDKHLVDLALESARKYRFTQSALAEQCGDIVIDFKLK